MKKAPVEKPWPVYDMAFSPDGRLLAAGRGYHEFAVGGEGEVAVWTTKNWKRQDGFCASFTDQAEAIAFTADSKNLFAATNKYREFKGGDPRDGILVFEWAVAEGALTETICINKDSKPVVGDMMGMALSPNGELIALACLASRPAILRRKSGERAYELEGEPGQVIRLAFAPNGKSLVSIRLSQPYVHLYDAANGKELASFDLKCANPAHVEFNEEHGSNLLVGDVPTCVRLSPDGKRIAVGVSDGSLRLLTADLTKQIQSLEVSPGGENVGTITFAARADLLAAATPTRVRLFDSRTGKRLREWGKEELKATAVSLSPDGKLLAVGYGGKLNVNDWPRGGFVKVWDTATGRLVKEFE